MLIIITDDQRAGMSFMPKTRRLFEDGGRRYRSAFVSNPLCCPSRVSIMTGLFPHNHRSRTNSPVSGFTQDSLQRALGGLGYRTAIFGKFLNNWPIHVDPPAFDVWAVNENGYRGGRWNTDGRVATRDMYDTELIGDRAVRFIRNTERPWLMYITPRAPHAPFKAQPKYADLPVPRLTPNPAMRERRRGDKPPFVRAQHYSYAADGAAIRRQQFRTLPSVDDLVGRIYGELRRQGEAGNTLAFFLSDNGYLWGEHGLIGKRVPYTQATQVPFYVRWPRHVVGGRTSPRLTSLVDIAPTVLSSVGLSAANKDGHSLFDYAWQRHHVLIEYAYDGPLEGAVPSWASLRSLRWQYVEYYSRETGAVTFREYYRLDRDPWQTRNLLRDGRSGPDVRHLRAALEAARRCRGAGCP